VIDDVLRTAGFSRTQFVIQTAVEHVEIKVSHSGLETIQGDPFLPG